MHPYPLPCPNDNEDAPPLFCPSSSFSPTLQQQHGNMPWWCNNNNDTMTVTMHPCHLPLSFHFLCSNNDNGDNHNNNVDAPAISLHLPHPDNCPHPPQMTTDDHNNNTNALAVFLPLSPSISCSNDNDGNTIHTSSLPTSNDDHNNSTNAFTVLMTIIRQCQGMGNPYRYHTPTHTYTCASDCVLKPYMLDIVWLTWQIGQIVKLQPNDKLNFKKMAK